MDTKIVDRPFALPAESVEIAIDLPFPPSTNQLFGRKGRLVFKTDKYKHWLRAADGLVLLHGSQKQQKIKGKFEATLLLDEAYFTKRDLDNCWKATLDFVVRLGLVDDDRYCWRQVAHWVPYLRAPHGCLLILRSLHG